MTHSEITDLASHIRSHLSVLNSAQQAREQAVLLRKAAVAVEAMQKESEELRRLLRSVSPPAT